MLRTRSRFNNVKDRMGEMDKHVSDGINKLLFENKCGLTSQEELSTDERAIRAHGFSETCDRRVVNPAEDRSHELKVE